MHETPTEPTEKRLDPADAQAEQAEAKAIRRRWLTIGEGVAVTGVLIAALSLWNNWSERRDAATIRAAEQASTRAEANAARHRIGLIATGTGGDSLAFKGVACALQATDIRFPQALGVAPQYTVTVHEIRVGWLAKPLLAMTDNGPDRRRGRLPVLIDSRCESASGTRVESAIYDLAWEIVPGLFGRSLKLRGLVQREDEAGKDGKARLDSLWKKP